MICFQIVTHSVMGIALFIFWLMTQEYSFSHKLLKDTEYLTCYLTVFVFDVVFVNKKLGNIVSQCKISYYFQGEIFFVWFWICFSVCLIFQLLQFNGQNMDKKTKYVLKILLFLKDNKEWLIYTHTFFGLIGTPSTMSSSDLIRYIKIDFWKQNFEQRIDSRKS